MAERNSCPYLRVLSKACNLEENCNHDASCSSSSINSCGDSDCSINHAQCNLKLDQQETWEILDKVIIHFGKSRTLTSTLPNQDGITPSTICNCFSSWFKNNNKNFMWDAELKKAFLNDSNVPFQTSTSTSCKIDTSSSLFNSFKEFIGSAGSSPKLGFLSGTSDNKELLLEHHSKIIEDLKTCWKRRHQIRPFPDNIQWILTLLQEWKIPFKNLFENQEIESCKEDLNPKIFVGFKKHDVKAYFRNCIMTALHAIVQYKLPTVTCILGDEQHVYIIKLDYKRSLKKTLLSIFKYSMYNNWNHQCSLYLHLYKLFDSCLPNECSVSMFEAQDSLNTTTSEESITTTLDKQLPTLCTPTLEDSTLSATENGSSHEIPSPKIQAIKQRTEEILRTISSQHCTQSR